MCRRESSASKRHEPKPNRHPPRTLIPKCHVDGEAYSKTPFIHETFGWKSLSVIGAISLWRILFWIHPGSVKGPQVVDFLKLLARHTRQTPSLPVPRPANDATREKQIPFRQTDKPRRDACFEMGGGGGQGFEI